MTLRDYRCQQCNHEFEHEAERGRVGGRMPALWQQRHGEAMESTSGDLSGQRLVLGGRENVTSETVKVSCSKTVKVS